jgi:hypothetical protein
VIGRFLIKTARLHEQPLGLVHHDALGQLAVRVIQLGAQGLELLELGDATSTSESRRSALTESTTYDDTPAFTARRIIAESVSWENNSTGRGQSRFIVARCSRVSRLGNQPG